MIINFIIRRKRPKISCAVRKGREINFIYNSLSSIFCYMSSIIILFNSIFWCKINIFKTIKFIHIHIFCTKITIFFIFPYIISSNRCRFTSKFFICRYFIYSFFFYNLLIYFFYFYKIGHVFAFYNNY